MKKACILIAGPTGTGKSQLAIELAAALAHVEIINCDVGQLYEPLSIGTAKPDWRNERNRHHLFDTLVTPRDYSVMEFRTDVQKTIELVWSSGSIPFVVGGSGFYGKSLMFPPQLTQAKKMSSFDYQSYATIQLWNLLHTCDPERAQKIHTNDRYRIVRALDIAQTTGEKSSNYKPVFDPLCPTFIIFVTREREDLYGRIDQRVHAMIAQGWLNEIATLSPEWKNFVRTKKLIGYPELLDYFESQKPIDAHIINAIQQTTRHYAKRQITFWRSWKKQVQIAEETKNSKDRMIALREVNLTLSPLSLYINQLKTEIKEFMETI